MLTIVLFFAGLGAGYWLATATMRPSRWRVELPPADVDRGPNADHSYRAVMLGGHAQPSRLPLERHAGDGGILT